MAHNQKRDAQGRFVRTTPDWESIAQENLRKADNIEIAYWELLEFVLAHRFAFKRTLIEKAEELLDSAKEY